MPKVYIRSALSAVVLLLSNACESPVRPNQEVPVEFVYGVHRPQVEPAFVVEVQAASIQVRGYLLTPCQPYDASAAAEVVEQTLVLRVTGEASGDCPQDVVSSVGYKALLRASSSKHTRLRVVHEWRDANWPAQTVVDTALSE